MLIHKTNDELVSNTKRVKLRILASGYAKSDSDWKDSIINTPYSRLYFVLNGEFHIISNDGEEYIFRAGNAYLIPAGYSYSFGCRETMEHVYFHIQLSSFDHIDLLKIAGHPLSITLPLRNADYYKELVLSKTLDSSFRIQSEIYSLLCSFFEKYEFSFEGTQYTFGVSEAIKYIKENLSIQLDINEVSRAAHLATSTLTRKFRHETGMSVGEYIDSLVMISAEQKLVSGEQSVLEISEQYGFCDQFYFSRRFKERFGMSPRAYKKKPNI